MPTNLNCRRVLAGGREQPLPILPSEAARDGDRSVVLDEAVPTREARQQPESMQRDRMPVQIANEPAPHGRPLHPLDERDEGLVRKVMRHLRADHEIKPTPEFGREHVAGAEIDRHVRGRRSAGNRFAHGVEVESDEVEDEASAAAPSADGPQDVSVAIADIDQRDALTGADPRHGALEPAQDRPARERDGVDFGKVLQAAAILVNANRLRVHEFGLGAPAPEIMRRERAHATSRNRKVSATRPGPNAMATPLEFAGAERIMRSSTNIRVAEDMLP